MQVTVEKLSNIERKLTIIVPAKTIESAVEEQLNHLARKVKLDGFRPGKAPRSLIQQRFGDDARKEAMSRVIENALVEALTDHKLRPINTPRVEPKLVSADQSLEFSATFEVFPEIEKVTFTLPQIEKATVEVTDADVDKVVEQLRKQYATWEPVERVAATGDRVLLDYYAIFDGKEELDNKVNNFPLELGSGRMLPGFEEGLLGAKAGDERQLSLVFPEDFHVTDRAGKPIEFVIQVKKVIAATIPNVDSDFVSGLGIKSGDVADLKNQIRESLEAERDRVVNEKVKDQLFQKLLDQNPLDVPKSMVTREAANIHDEVYKHQHHDHHSHSDEEMKTFEEMATKRVGLGILIAEFARQHNLVVDKAKVNQRIQEIAAAYEQPQEVIEWLSKDERRNGIEAQVLEDQVMEKLLEGTAVIEKKMSYAELKGI